MDPQKVTRARARARLNAAVRAFFSEHGYDEVETPCLVPAPGMEPHIACFEAPFVPEGGGAPVPLWLHSSPEYAMKRLLAAGFERIFQLARVFRNGEVSATHNPEFTMLEFYRAHADHEDIMRDLERLVEAAAGAVAGGTAVRRGGVAVDLAAPFERLAVAEAFQRRAGLDLDACGEDGERLRAAAHDRGLPVGPEGEGFDDLFFRIFLERVEPGLGAPRPVYLVDWPARMASLAKLTADGRHARRFELYVAGLELANGFCELNDAAEQRRRLEEERALRARLGRPAYPIDERFVEAVGRMPDAGGVAVGLDRLLMLLAGAERIEEVLLFPACEFL
ncbi:EF-P lysine aminoacylase EpmA [Anaeromyxobacter paludicola]|uniref:EF-P lysine aminoacylase GenX n=1 Tax=Anaeromyxobacter paludicola TaxID=2918171 RepID=A0ABM7XEQ9_9BACT|nr:EF-P lysine aminoacylase EpmA [Anaeromyxobacter paludicola]BDG10339.1 EF-P lysine aminoacylase GenX [Anaeromyxobacter paludicola]